MADLLYSSGIDWRDQSRNDSIIAEMVDPSSLQPTGTLDNLVLSGCSIDANYYSDSRVSAKLSYEGDGWQRNRAIRIIHSVPSEGYRRELGTFLVTNDDGDWDNGRWVGDLTCQSMLWAVQQKKLSSPLTVQSSSPASLAFQNLFHWCRRRYVIEAYVYNVYSATKVYEAGKSYLDVANDICALTDTRLDVTGHGFVQVTQDMKPSLKSPTFELSIYDPRGIMHDGISRSSDYGSLPSEVAVSCKYSVEVEKEDGVYKSNQDKQPDGTYKHKKGDKKYKKVSEQRELDSHIAFQSGPKSEQERGYAVTYYKSIDDKELTPKTQMAIDTRAAHILSQLPDEAEEWTVTTQYFPVWTGDVGYLTIRTEGHSQGHSRCKVFVRALSINLGSMQQTLTLRKTSYHNEVYYSTEEVSVN